MEKQDAVKTGVRWESEGGVMQVMRLHTYRDNTRYVDLLRGWCGNGLEMS